MNHKALDRLEVLRRLNGSNRNWINKDLYRLLYKEELYIVAYEKIKSKPGNMTSGADGTTIDGFSTKIISEIINDMRTEAFQFAPTRRVEIPKPNGGKRKLGIPSIRDKVVQEVMRMILESIYDSPSGAYFQDNSHGFRPKKSTHTALMDYRKNWKSINWIIEGDIKGCFDNIDHHTLINILRQKISDEKFFRLIWKLLRAGYMEFNVRQNSLTGTPQGGIVSPILANIYLNKLDTKVLEIKEKLDRGKAKRVNPEYHRIKELRRRRIKKHGTETPETKALRKKLMSIPYVMVNDPNFIRVKYIRYADDWIIGVCGSYQLAKSIKNEISDYLQNHLQLTLSDEKTKITNARTEKAHFLGTELSIGRNKAEIHIKTKKNYTTRAIAAHLPTLKAPIKNIVKRLHNRGFCTSNDFPQSRRDWTSQDTEEIIRRFSSINLGILNYYRFSDNFNALSRIQYILQFSLAKTLAHKYKTSIKKIFKRYGKDISYTFKAANERTYSVSFKLNHDWTRKPMAFQIKKEHPEIIQEHLNLRTRSKLGKPCVICGAEESIEMHHIRHIRKGKKTNQYLKQIMNQLNRKQIPTCKGCHRKIHRGEYDGLKLCDLAYDPR